jgi:hypothetical protein
MVAFDSEVRTRYEIISPMQFGPHIKAHEGPQYLGSLILNPTIASKIGTVNRSQLLRRAKTLTPGLFSQPRLPFGAPQLLFQEKIW